MSYGTTAYGLRPYGLPPAAAAGGAVNTSVTLSPVAFTFTPASLSAKTNRLVTLTGPSFTYSPNSLTQVTTRKASLSPVSWSWSVQSLAAQTTRNATLSPAAFTYSPNDLTTQLTRKATLSPVSYSLSVNDLTAVFVGSVAYAVTLSPVAFTYTPANLTASVTTPVDTGTYNPTGGGGAAYFYRGKYRGEIRRTIQAAIADLNPVQKRSAKKQRRKVVDIAARVAQSADIAVPDAAVFVPAPELANLEVIRLQVLKASQDLANAERAARQRDEEDLARTLQAALVSYMEEIRRIEQREEEEVLALIMAVDRGA